MRIFCVEASYSGGINPDRDKAMRKILGMESGAGMMLIGERRRDMSWEYPSTGKAERAASRLRMAMRGKVKVHIYKIED